jgi:hypothetical protein
MFNSNMYGVHLTISSLGISFSSSWQWVEVNVLSINKALSFCHQIGGDRRTQQGCRLAQQDLDEKETARKNPKKRGEHKNN